MNLLYITHRTVTQEVEGATIIYVVIMYISSHEPSLNIYPVEFFFFFFFELILSIVSS